MHCCRSTAGELSLVRSFGTHCVFMGAMVEGCEWVLVARPVEKPLPGKPGEAVCASFYAVLTTCNDHAP